MTRKSGGEHYVFERWMPVDDEVLIRRHRIQADCVIRDLPRDSRQMVRKDTHQSFLFVQIDCAIHRERIIYDSAARVFGKLYAAVIEFGKAIKDIVWGSFSVLRQLEKEHRHTARYFIGGFLGRKPKQRFAADA